MKKLAIATLFIITTQVMGQTQLHFPRDPVTHKTFAMRSSADGVCKFLGYDQALNGSKKLGIIIHRKYGPKEDTRFNWRSPYREDSLVIRKDGTVRKIKSDAMIIESIVCI